MADHDGHTVNVGPVTVGETLPKADPIDTDAIRTSVCGVLGPVLGPKSVVIRLCGDVDRHDDYLLTVAIRDALGEGS